jgi:hypothetical protein
MRKPQREGKQQPKKATAKITKNQEFKNRNNKNKNKFFRDIYLSTGWESGATFDSYALSVTIDVFGYGVRGCPT